ncbi:MAG: hypothetical protein PVH88_22715 [Ignavibacteria bacterium]|jgi:hypothetical protein
MRFFITVLLLITSLYSLPQNDGIAMPPNSILKNFKPFPTPRTNYRPGTVYRIAQSGVQYFVEDVKAINAFESDEGTITGRMSFTKSQILSLLNIEIDVEYVTLEVEIKNAIREFNEQTTLDDAMWEKDNAERLIQDDSSKYFIIRETVTTQEITYRFSEADFNKIITGKSTLAKARARGDEVIDFPYSVTKKFKIPRRLFYLDQQIEKELYPHEE